MYYQLCLKGENKEKGPVFLTKTHETEIFLTGCGTVGRAVASDTKGSPLIYYQL